MMVIKDRLDSLDRLILVQVKVKRAEKHLHDLAAEVLSLEDTTILTPDPNTGIAPHPMAMLAPNNFQKVPTLSFDVVTMAGDIVHNLRSALDHLAQQLVAVGMACAPIIPLTPIELRQIEFPIAETVEKYEADKARKIKGMLPEAIEVIDRLKPYKGGNDALWRIHELDNIDKHRALFTMAHDFLFTAHWFPGSYLLKAENPHFAGIEAEVEHDIQLEIEEAVGKSQVTQPNALLPSLHQLVDFVDNLVPKFTSLHDFHLAAFVHSNSFGSDKSLIGFYFKTLPAHLVEVAGFQSQADAMQHEPSRLLSHSDSAG